MGASFLEVPRSGAAAAGLTAEGARDRVRSVDQLTIARDLPRRAHGCRAL